MQNLQEKLEALLNLTVEELWTARVSSEWMISQIDLELAKRKGKAEDLSAYKGLGR